MDEHLLVLSRIVELASAETGIDQPLCTSCAARFAKELEREVQEAKDDIRAYEQALERLEAMPADSAVMDALHRDVEETEAQIREEEAALAVLHERKLELIKELDDTAAEEARAREESDAADRLLLEYEAGLQEHLGERDALLAKINRAEREHDRLTKARPFVDCFHIWYDGPFGTITGFRLGRTPEEPVPWEEINAGLGQCVALLDAMARAWRRPFSKYRLVPMGSTSKIVDGKTTYPLYGPPRVKILAWKFDHAMVCYLTCLNEFATFLAEQEPPTGGGNVRRLELPFPIEGDRVNNMTVKVSFNREATWTKALKYMLADLKTVVHYMLDITDGHPADALGWVPSEAAAREDPGAQRRQSAGAGPSGVRQG
ncbi:unnamed protein product [Pedinophyceae sp. YPF-701]|nr:unnamed protein product [Pedinophyceae sp. YPF-701]